VFGLMKPSLTIFLVQFARLTAADSTFNYEISARVKEEVQSFLSESSTAATLPLYMLQSGVVNATDFYASQFLPGSRLFFNLVQLYNNQITLFKFCFPNKIYFSLAQAPASPNGIILNANTMSNLKVNNVFYVKPNGLPSGLANCSLSPTTLCPFSYDCTTRGWYKQGSTTPYKQWIAPFLQSVPAVPAISINIPFIRNGKFVVLICTNIELQLINNYLVNTYSSTNRNIFIVDAPTGLLIANSLNASLTTPNGKVSNYRIFPLLELNFNYFSS